MAGWVAVNQKSKPRVFERIEKDVGCIVSPKSTLNLMQNCDLPPPIKLFSGSDGVLLSSISKIYGMGEDEQIPMHKYCSGEDKLEILKALRLSQTRAREAERKIRVLSNDKDVLLNLLVDDSMRVFAHRQWLNLLELQVLKLRRLQQEKENMETYHGASTFSEKSSKQEDDGDEGSGKKWLAAMVFCLAIAGIGFAFGCRCLF